jgi:aspartate aminotransferase
MYPVSERLAALSPSETLAMSQKSNELKAQGIDVINLSVGEPDFYTPDHIKEAAKQAVDNNFSFYSPVPGYPALRNAICSKLKTENNLIYKPEQIVCSNGAKQSVCNVILAIVSKGDEVIIPAPYWVSYPEMVTLADGKSVSVYAGIEQDFKITAAQLEEAITPKTKVHHSIRLQTYDQSIQYKNQDYPRAEVREHTKPRLPHKKVLVAEFQHLS